MSERLNTSRLGVIGRLGLFLLPILLFWVILLFKIPYSLSQYFQTYSLGLFLIVLILYYLSFRLPGKLGTLVCLGLTMTFFALTLSYKWTSGYSDNKIIAGLLPYKDGMGYYFGANLFLNGLPLENTVQAGWRPLFPGFLSSMLLLNGGNLKWALALLVLMAGIGLYYSVRQIFASMGALPASLFITFLYFYIQPLIGLTMTELLGFTIGCFAFSILWQTSYNPKLSDFVLGLLALLLALSVRAGTFFILPLLALWGGRIFRGTGKFSFKVFVIAITTILIGYYFANSVFARLSGVPEGTIFGNFAYSIYGQVHGGAGWYQAIDELGTTKPSLIYKAAFQFFLQHPQSLLIGIAKSYRDFFLPGDGSIFLFNINDRLGWVNYAAWGAAIFLVIRGLVASVKKTASNTSLMLVAGFAGIFLSIPFLPPIDGGSRFYASTAPFFFAIPVVALEQVSAKRIRRTEVESFASGQGLLRAGILILSFLTVIMPLIILKLSSPPSFSLPACNPGQVPFVLNSYPGSYVDLVSNNNDCGLAPEICMNDFEKNSVEKSVDDFYRNLHSMTMDSDFNVRIIPALNLIDKRFHYFYISHDKILGASSLGLLSGCAVEIQTQYQSIYQVITILPR